MKGKIIIKLKTSGIELSVPYECNVLESLPSNVLATGVMGHLQKWIQEEVAVEWSGEDETYISSQRPG
jgi:hypothetical protein